MAATVRCFTAIVSLAGLPIAALADVTNINSPVVSYLLPEWAGIDVLPSSPVSYFYQISDAPGFIILTGTVTDTGGSPLSSATVTALVGLAAVAQTATGPDGSYELPPLGAGVYALRASAPNYASSARVVTLSPNTARQDFRLRALPATPSVVQTTRQPPAAFTQPPVGLLGSALKIFDGTQFVAIDAGHAPSPDRMTIVLTHGWVPSIAPDPAILSTPFDLWPSNMAVRLRAHGVAASLANIVAWDWRYAAMGPFPPEENTPSQGTALGAALQAALFATY